jgi:hypothetical protein
VRHLSLYTELYKLLTDFDLFKEESTIEIKKRLPSATVNCFDEFARVKKRIKMILIAYV